jgi:hypothetical protein
MENNLSMISDWCSKIFSNPLFTDWISTMTEIRLFVVFTKDQSTYVFIYTYIYIYKSAIYPQLVIYRVYFIWKAIELVFMLLFVVSLATCLIASIAGKTLN